MIDTKRLHIRPIEEDDWEFVQSLSSTDDFKKYIGIRDVSTKETTLEYINGKMISHHEKYGYGNYVIELKKKKVPVGTVSLFWRDEYNAADIGYALLPDHYGKGYTVEAASALMTYGHVVHGMNVINGFCKENNEHSIKILQKLGMKKVKKVKWDGEDEQNTLYFKLEF